MADQLVYSACLLPVVLINMQFTGRSNGLMVDNMYALYDMREDTNFDPLVARRSPIDE